MSSSSDSEDDERFRAACDLSLSVSYYENSSKGPQELEVQGSSNATSATSEDTRKSFLLATKIQNILDFKKKKGKVNVAELHSQKCPLSSTSLRKKANGSLHGDLKSSLSPYLSRQLLNLLDEKVDITSVQPAEATCHLNDSKNGLYLLKNKPFKSFISDAIEKKPKRTPIINNYDEKEVVQRCQTVALTPEWILGKKDVYPWPHPKNIRYIDKYKIKKKKPDGTIVIVPYKDCTGSGQNNLKVRTVTNGEERDKLAKNGKRKESGEREVSEESTGLSKNSSAANTKSNEKNNKIQYMLNEPHIEQSNGPGYSVKTNGDIKKRKQSRKRSGKKAKRKFKTEETQ